MTTVSKNAYEEFENLIDKLKSKSKLLSIQELNLILKQSKVISTNPQLIDIVTGSLSVLLNKQLNRKELFSEREKQVTLLIGKGLQNEEIAKTLQIRKSTIETHRKNIRKKLKLNEKDSLMIFALIYQIQNNLYNETNNSI